MKKEFKIIDKLYQEKMDKVTEEIDGGAGGYTTGVGAVPTEQGGIGMIGHLPTLLGTIVRGSKDFNPRKKKKKNDKKDKIRPDNTIAR